MPGHSLSPGSLWIGNMLALGEALGYVLRPEHNVAGDPVGDSPVDVAWFRSGTDIVPLFIFEVESRAGSQMAHNAGKVLSQSTAVFEKPLFFFHIVVTGGRRSTRPVVAQELFGKFNYRVYLATAAGTTTRLICDILSEHRRVSDVIDPIRLVQSLEADPLPGLDLDDVLRHAEAIGLRANWLHDYTLMSVGDKRMLDHVARHIEGEVRGAPPDGTQYETWLGVNFSGPLHLGLLTQLRPAFGQRCLSMLQTQEQSERPCVPGRNADADTFFFGFLPFLWALLAALMCKVDGAGSWFLTQIESIFSPRDYHVAVALGGFAAVWALHLAAALGADDAYGLAQRYLDNEGGVSMELLLHPPSSGGNVLDLGPWEDQLADQAMPVLEMRQLRAAVLDLHSGGDAVAIALRALVDPDPSDFGPGLAGALQRCWNPAP